MAHRRTPLTYSELNSAEEESTECSVEFHALSTHAHGPGEALGPLTHSLTRHPDRLCRRPPSAGATEASRRVSSGGAAVRDRAHGDAGDGGRKAMTPNEAFRGP